MDDRALRGRDDRRSEARRAPSKREGETVSEAVLGSQLGDHLAEARREIGMSQKRLAERLGISLWAVDQLEQGVRDSQRHAKAIARATGLDVRSLEQISAE